ncbi:MAG TPA: helix-turn-helix domain-containing protein [Candidatus Thermoplasmatota archaeon]|nr:helix-turn-helix domain-containing protein [Candidatus Thermoplasmatota archaeon]
MVAAPAPAPAVEFPDGLPNSARQVFETLASQGPLTHKDLVRATGMPGRTVRYAVGRLKEAGVIGARCNLQDCRQCYFFVAQQCPGGGASPFVRTSWRAL